MHARQAHPARDERERAARRLRLLRGQPRSTTLDETVLLVEDDTEMRRLLARSLERAGHRVVAVRSSEEAVDWLGLSVFDGSLGNVPALIPSDIRLPDAREHVPIGRITGFPSPETYAGAFALGALRVREELFDLATLRIIVRAALDERGGPDRRGPRA